MSSAVYVTFERKISVSEWREYCEEAGLTYSPRTVGGKTYYRGEVEVTLGGHGDAPDDPFERLTVSSYFMRNLEEVAATARGILTRFGGSYKADSELEGMMEEGPPVTSRQIAHNAVIGKQGFVAA
ncbi:MAG: hypothetical protein CYG60_08485, partial [Actinobacteria bacterium]